MHIETIFHYLTTYQIPAIFIGAFFFGEAVILVAALLAQQGMWDFSTVFFVSLIATVLSDSLCFWFGYEFFFKKKWFLRYEKKYEASIKFLDEKVKSKPYLSLLIIKFLYGTRLLTIIYLAVRQMKFIKFFLFDTLGTVVWLVVMLLIGWLAGNGIGNIFIVGRLSKILLALIVGFFVYQRIEKYISKRFTNKENIFEK